MEEEKLLEKFRNSSTSSYKLGFIGCGNMAQAIVKGILSANIVEAKEILISGTSQKSFDEKWKDLHVNTTLDNNQIVDSCKIVFLCVKPFALSSVAESLRRPSDPDESVNEGTTLVSILAAIPLKSIKESLPMFATYARVMPNTPLSVSSGCVAITNLSGRNSSQTDLNFQIIKIIFQSLGIVEVIDDESKFHAITALSGSGPAYVFLMIEALSDAGVKQGLPRDLSTRFAAQTLLGASKMVLESGLHPGQLKDQVTSSGGTTIYGLHELEKGGMRNTLINAVESAALRSKDMSK